MKAVNSMPTGTVVTVAWRVSVALALTALGASCGSSNNSTSASSSSAPSSSSSSSSTPAATSQVPSSASQSIAGFVAYLQALAAASADTLEPVATATVTGPTDETSEPMKVN